MFWTPIGSSVLYQACASGVLLAQSNCGMMWLLFVAAAELQHSGVHSMLHSTAAISMADMSALSVSNAVCLGVLS